jgi:hypothetical protein
VGLNVEARIARMSYGIKYGTPFIAGKHRKVDKAWDDNEQEYQARNQMVWFLKEVTYYLLPGRIYFGEESSSP